MAVDNQLMPSANKDLIITEVDGELLVLDQAGGQIHQLNPSAAFVFSCCDGQSTRLVVQEKMIKEFAIEAQTAAQDLELALGLLAAQGLLTE